MDEENREIENNILETDAPVEGDTEIDAPVDEGDTEIDAPVDEGDTETDAPVDEGDTEIDAPVEGDGNATEDGAAQVTVGDFSVGFDASRISDTGSGFFVADNADTGAILFDVSNPETLSTENNQLTIGQADLLVSPEFAAVLGDESLQGADVGDTRIDASTETQDGNTFDVESGVTSVFLDLPVLESAAGFELASVDSETEPFSDEFQAGFNINDETDFTFNTEDGFTPVDGAIEHDGTITFNTEAIDDNSEESDSDIPVDIDENDGDSDLNDTDDDTTVDEGDLGETPVDEDSSISDASAFETIDLTDEGDQTIEFTVNREAAFDNTIGFYEVDENGGVVDSVSGETIAVGEEGYQDAAIANSLDFTLSTGNGETSTFTADISGGTQYGTFIIADGGLDELLDADATNDPAVYFASAEANDSNFDHVISLGENSFGYEDLPNGIGEEFSDITPDFNDMVVDFDFV